MRPLPAQMCGVACWGRYVGVGDEEPEVEDTRHQCAPVVRAFVKTCIDKINKTPTTSNVQGVWRKDLDLSGPTTEAAEQEAVSRKSHGEEQKEVFDALQEVTGGGPATIQRSRLCAMTDAEDFLMRKSTRHPKRCQPWRREIC